jgi:tetratricopeptide (TPR) repeat protein
LLWLRAELNRAEEEASRGNYGLARNRLTKLVGRWPYQAEVAYKLGICERVKGRREAALAAWSRVPLGSPFFAKAAAWRGTTLTELGKYAPAESVLESALGGASGPDAEQVQRALIRLYRLQGRMYEVRRLLRDVWGRSAEPAGVLKELWDIDAGVYPMVERRRVLDAADPADDRVWLAQANLAIRTGWFEEARKRLDDCLRRRPDDRAVWRALRDLHLATHDVEGVWRVLPHLPAREFSPSQVLVLRVWFVAHTGDVEAERRALEVLLEGDPANTPAADRLGALERLAVLTLEAGRPAEAAELRRRKARLDDAIAGYRQIMNDEANLASRAEELAQLAETLGRRFDAQAWRSVARGSRGRIDAVPAESAGMPDPRDGRTLADLLADLQPAPVPKPTARPAQPDAPARPIDPGFTDDAEAVGLRFVFDMGRTPECMLPETMSGGVGLLDFNGDGWLDVYVVQGGPFPPPPQAGTPTTQAAQGDRLFANRGDGTFTDVTTASGIATFPPGYGHGVTVGDYDNDGDPDLFITRWRSYALYRNNGNGTFTDVTGAAGLGGDRGWPTSAAFADLDNDGDLDLYVCHYLIFDAEHPMLCPDAKGGYRYCEPSKFPSEQDHLFRNDHGRFVDVTAAAGIVDPVGRGLGVVAVDVDDDGRTDLFVANDGMGNYLFHNLGGLRFEEIGHVAGIAGNAQGGYQASMGIACGDLDEDGRPDLVVTNFFNESSTLFQNLGQGLFGDRTSASGLGPASRYYLGFGTAFLDYNNDGRLDLLTANGNVNDERPYNFYGMPVQLLAGQPGGRLGDVSAGCGPPWGVLRIGRGLAAGDLDNDGRVDAVILSQNEPLAYFHNRAPCGHSVTFRLEGTVSNRDGVGAVVTVNRGGRRQVVPRFGGGSYQSACDPRLHFGLGAATRIETLEVRWPSGRTDRFSDLAIDQGYLIREGDAAPKPMAGFGRKPGV